jgi:uncharacterized protein YbaR (Trm112 family)
VQTETRSLVEVLLACPICGGNLDPLPDQVTCENCRHAFPVDDGPPQLFWQNDWPADKPDVTRAMQAFCERTPFPNYDDFDSAEALRLKARRSVFAKLLDEQIRHGSFILEVGCGTGQLSNFLGVTWGRTVIGADWRAAPHKRPVSRFPDDWETREARRIHSDWALQQV